AILLFQAYGRKPTAAVKDFNFPKFLQAVDSGEVETVTFRQDTGEITGTIKKEFEQKYGGQYFNIVGNTGDKVYEDLKSKGIVPNYEKAENNSLLQSLFINGFPVIIIFLMFIFFMRQIQIGGGKAMSFGKSRARLLTENKNRVTFKDVAGIDEVKDELSEIIAFLKDPKKYTKLGGRIPKGVLLVGPPGTGKTLLARAVAGEAGVPFFSLSGSDFVEMFVGVGASRVRDLFEQGKKNAPCLIFIDEIDAVGRHRGAGMGGGHDEREQTLNQLLVEMDGFESNEGVILIAATNRPDVLDPALLRPGRFDRRVVVNKPDVKGRLEILRVHTRKTPLADEVNLDQIARGTPGFSGADLENLVNEAALLAARRDKKKLDLDDFEMAKDKVLMGAERKSMAISDEDKRITAYHEAGHTIVGRTLPGLDPIHKVTIIPRGMALGVTQTLPEEERMNLTKKKAENMISFLFGGRVAEALIFHDYTTGAGNDIERATEIARRMVTEWGMSEKLGPQKYESRDHMPFAGMGNSPAKEYSDKKAEEIDQEVSRLISEGYEKAKKILEEKRETLHKLAEALLERESLDGDEVEIIMNGGTLADIDRERELRRASLAKQNAEVKEEADAKAKPEPKKTPIGDPGPVTA
ncbi:MAG TPA: ATP-dependent zinc metalloprotease FtsH, partial [Bdellovibrionales bacterium]|nr:ATP-dependent zinc metalloprotease FtsH [Bdellovibrionales bacterium]